MDLFFLFGNLLFGILNMFLYVNGDNPLVINLVVGCLSFFVAGIEFERIINRKLKKDQITITVDDMENMIGRTYVETFHSCPMCIDCPDGCPLDKCEVEL